MTLTALIDCDCKRLNSYFYKLFDVLGEAIAEDQTAPLEAHDIEASESQATYHSFANFIKPDMLMNIYSLVDFWMKEICMYLKSKNNLSLSYKDIKGDHDLQIYQKYLTKYAGLDLNAAQVSYEYLDALRKIRNQFIHSGGHVPSDKEKVLSVINGITLHGSLIVIDNSFVWITLDHAKKYLYAAAQALGD
jgi:hypothetical protein